MTDKIQLVVTALQQRIGEIVSNYETQIAVLRAEVTSLIEEKEKRDNAVKEYSNHLDSITKVEE